MARASAQAPAERAALNHWRPREKNMRTLCLSIAAVSTFLSASCLANRADAITLGAPSAIRPMIVDIATVYEAHCRPGWVHHRYWPQDGCVEQSGPSYYRYHRS